MSTTTDTAAGRRQVLPVYGAGFVTAFGAHAVAANLGAFALGHHDSLLELGLILGVYDAAEVVLKPVFGTLVDRRGAKKVMVGGLVAFGLASAAFVAGGDPNLLGYRHHLDAVATGALVSLLAATAALLQPWAGRRLDRGRRHPAFAAGGLLACAAGFALVAGLTSPLAMAAAAVAIGAGVAAAGGCAGPRRCRGGIDMMLSRRASAACG